MVRDKIFIKGAREHNLKDIDVEIPRDKLVVITGVSGSGKSSLAFDTIYAEGQRRYIESLSSYARQFLGQMEKPDVDYIDGLSPAISIDQKTTSRNPRSTVGTVTEIHDYLRLLYARIGVPHCPSCGKEISQQTLDQMVDSIMQLEEGTRIQLLAPVVRGRKGEYKKLLDDIKKSGYVRVRIDNEVMDVNEPIELEKNKKHNIEIVVDRIIVKPNIQKRLADSIETVLKLSDGVLIVDVIGKEEILFSQNFACTDCGISMEELTPRMFSFNNPYGACPSCTGLGSLLKVDPDLVIPNKKLSLKEGAIAVAGWNLAKDDSYASMYMNALANHYNFSLSTPVEDLPEHILDVILYGTKGEKVLAEYNGKYGDGTFMTSFEGIVNSVERRYNETQKEEMKQYYEQFMSENLCSECNGARLKKEVLAVTVGGKNIHEVSCMSVGDAKQFFKDINLSERDRLIARQILKEINERLGFLVDVGLDYLTLSRAAGTLSGGEAQRIRLATQIGSGLMGVLYILDEPSIGLHQRDNEKLLRTLKKMRDLGNTLIVVEHDEDTMYAADYIIDLGPGAGIHGGEIVAKGTVEEIKQNPKSITGQYLSGKKSIDIPKKRREPNGKWLKVVGARENNLKNIDVSFPLGVLTCVTGVSGSGKSSLVNEILYKRLASQLNRARTKAGDHDDIIGIEHLDKVIDIDQSPIGRTPRSNPGTYTGVFDIIRELFAETTESKTRGYKAGRFSFNVRGGRCEACRGDGIIKIEMHFLPDIYVPCEVCKGKRYNRETLEVRYKGKNIAEILDMTVEDALEFFKNIPKIQRKLQTLYDVGLGYIKLGQPSTTLSGGEAQRVKLATELSKRSTGRTMYILDEPTTGLHTADVHRLTDILQRLVEAGNTVVVIEHNLDVIKIADYIIDLGPEGGSNGGYIVAQGTPEEIIRVENSHTGRFLKRILSPVPKLKVL
ncbi:MAG TPA: excinuclease ABC subunit UvrA [Ruminiclostridium sp.]|jgi:excinuclease ABC subunit A|uniref:UvrABC system protein A n=1 Tax=Acetivibrio saccincola TaxID=1677857 RepID=A0A2K9END8_9FIRM|nr:excinuclease ABC subunit UvrA [Acetivibrio saccincola]HAA43168.1 excinuclease ABC subunit UvrA [Ruminiclostridium sp.]AUG56990.1 UvrABC system protein A [Acetivibrio saccincola]NLW26244.1 excinuclease ABC subunit UvrA [Acetivibrio saccincola]PQQ67008.1 excinuclease ABC subunit A [Acetivibrio saccincola]HOA97690.1 excinuclease ABC subunit UvrA [Acetivibrio saccincola]